MPERGPAVLVALKDLDEAKSRLLALGDETRRALVLAMLEDVLAAVRAAHRGSLFLLSEDERYGAAAGKYSAERIPDRAPGFREAVQAAIEVEPLARASAVLILPADLPQLRPQDVHSLLGALELAPVVLVPSADGGTSALGLRPPDAIPVAFGRGSAGLHRRLARRARLPLAEPPLPRLSVDVDTPADLQRVAGQVGPATRALLSEAGRAIAAAR